MWKGSIDKLQDQRIIYEIFKNINAQEERPLQQGCCIKRNYILYY
jgi:hypothetical protein